MKFFKRSFMIGCLGAMLAANLFAAAQDNDPHNPQQNRGAPSLQRLALQTIIKMEREQGQRLAPGQIPLHLERALEEERWLQGRTLSNCSLCAS